MAYLVPVEAVSTVYLRLPTKRYRVSVHGFHGPHHGLLNKAGPSTVHLRLELANRVIFPYFPQTESVAAYDVRECPSPLA